MNQFRLNFCEDTIDCVAAAFSSVFGMKLSDYKSMCSNPRNSISLPPEPEDTEEDSYYGFTVEEAIYIGLKLGFAVIELPPIYMVEPFVKETMIQNRASLVSKGCGVILYKEPGQHGHAVPFNKGLVYEVNLKMPQGLIEFSQFVDRFNIVATFLVVSARSEQIAIDVKGF
jgi:hypothetical protein